MYSSALPKTGLAFGAMGAATAAYQLAWLTIGLFVISGTLITLSKFFPRVAVEPLPDHRRITHACWRWRVTVNGVPVGGHHRR